MSEAQARRIRELEKEVRHMRASDLTENGCFWLFVVFLGALFIGVLFVGFPYYHDHHHPHLLSSGQPQEHVSPPGFYMKHQRSTRQHSPETCKVGETWDAEVGLCAPTRRMPLALEPAIMNNSVAPCDSFYATMCGKYIATHTNENRAFTYGWRRTRERLRRMIANTSDSTSPGALFYQACRQRGTPGAAKEALLEYQHALQVIVGPVRSHADLPSAWGRLARYGYTGPFALSMERHPLEARVLSFVSPDGFPDVLLDEGRLFQVLQAARALTQYTSLQETHHIEGILRVARALKEHRAPLQLTDVQDYGDYIEHTFPQHLVPFARLQPWPWERYMQALDGNALRFADNQTLWMPDRGYLEWLLPQGGWLSLGLSEWRSFLEFSVLWNNNQFEPELPNNVYFRQHDRQGPVGKNARLYHRLPRGASADPCLGLTEHMLPGWAADAFLKRYMPHREQIRAEVGKMVHQLLGLLGDKVARSTWLPDVDRSMLARKVDATLVRVLEPDDWHVEPFLASISRDRHDHNMNLVRRYRVQRNLALWHKDSPLHWSRAAVAFFAMPLTEMNAYYSGHTNSITLLAGVLQHPLYNVEYDAVSKWAILGSVVGHEMSHMLDTHGLHWDDEGRFAPRGILSPAGMERFYERVECVVREYGPAPAGCEDANAAYGNSTISEDMADLIGIGLSYAALPDSAATGDRQHFFMVLAQAFCESYDQQHRCDAVAHDEHAVAEFRIDRTFWNLGAWQEVFDCKRAQESCIPYA